MFCNTMGLPNPVEEVARARNVVWKGGKLASLLFWLALVVDRYGLAIVLAYSVGIVGFYYGLPVWSTYPDRSGGVWDRYSLATSR